MCWELGPIAVILLSRVSFLPHLAPETLALGGDDPREGLGDNSSWLCRLLRFSALRPFRSVDLSTRERFNDVHGAKAAASKLEQLASCFGARSPRIVFTTRREAKRLLALFFHENRNNRGRA